MQRFCILLALLAAVTFLPSRLQAQAAGNSGQDNAPSANSTTVTGCLQAGKKTGHYMLTADDGTTYQLRSRDVNLGEHVGHTVTVTGKVPQGKAAGEKSPSSTSSSDAYGSSSAQSGEGQDGHAGGGNMLFVTDLKMVSESCKK
jgi:hypothetical protein